MARKLPSDSFAGQTLSIILMHLFPIAPDRPFQAGINAGVAALRRLATKIFSALAWLGLTPAALLAESKVAVPLSPMVAKSNLVAVPDANKEISVILTLPLGDPQGAATFVQHVSTPGDPLFRRYIAPAEFAARFGANANDYAALKEWATVNGFRISQESSARTTLTLRGTVAQFQNLFATKLNVYQSADGKQFLSASVSPTIPNEISSKVSSVIGLTNSIQYAPLVKIAKTFGEDATTPSITTDTAGGTGPGGAYSAKDLRTAYEIPDYGPVSPQTVAVFEQGGFSESDLRVYQKRMGLPDTPVKFVSVNGYNGEVNDPTIELEAVLDIDMIIGINPHVGKVLVYEDGNDSFQVALIDALQQVASDDLAKTLSVSYGLDEVLQPAGQMDAENTALTQLAAEGINVLVSSGDYGALGLTGLDSPGTGLNVEDPASQPLVTSVGGTSLFTRAKEAYSTETVWNNYSGATGGGVSSYWTIPSYQSPSYVTGNGGSATMRNLPDIGAVADPNTGVAIYSLVNGGWVQVGGTSVSAPIWGGYISVLNSGLEYITGLTIGQLNPFLYNLNQGDPSFFLHSVLYGSNGISGPPYNAPGYSAGGGYNNCTGSGTPRGFFAWAVLSSEGGGIPPGNFTVKVRDLTATSVTLAWSVPTGVTTGYLVEVNYFNYMTRHNVFYTYVTKNRELTVKHLIPETQYFAEVTAVNPQGQNGIGASFIPIP